MALEAALSELIVGTTPAQLDDTVRAAVVRQVVDCIGVTLAGAAHPAGAVITGVVRELGGADQAQVLGSPARTSVAEAAWANGSLAHLLDFDDTGFSHPTACVLPAALAVAEWTGASGAALVAAMTVGYEVFERLAVCSRANEPLLRRRGLHPTAVWGGPAAAAAAASLLGLTREQTATALGLATGSASGVSQHFGSWAKGVTAGNAARSGVVAALLARRGYRINDHAISGEFGLLSALVGKELHDQRLAEDGLGERWAIVDPGLSIKPYPACTSTLRAVDAMLELAGAVGYRPDDVQRIVVEVHPDLLNTLRFRSPIDGFQGKFSLDYTVASAALDGALTLASFSDGAARRPELRAMLARTELALRPEWPLSRFYETPVAVTFADGTVATRSVRAHRGTRARPLSDDELTQKFVTCARELLPADRAEEAAKAVWAMAEADDVGDTLHVVSLA